jgi:hypothetical protein
MALSSCATDPAKRAAPSPVTTVESGTSSSSSSSSSSTTTPVPTSTATSRPVTTVASLSPEGYAHALFAAWTKNDVAAAQKVAQPEAVTALFARPWQAGDGWSFAECSGAAGSLICTWQRPSGQQVLFRVRNVTGGLPAAVLEVRFQP